MSVQGMIKRQPIVESGNGSNVQNLPFLSSGITLKSFDGLSPTESLSLFSRAYPDATPESQEQDVVAQIHHSSLKARANASNFCQHHHFFCPERRCTISFQCKGDLIKHTREEHKKTTVVSLPSLIDANLKIDDTSGETIEEDSLSCCDLPKPPCIHPACDFCPKPTALNHKL